MLIKNYYAGSNSSVGFYSLYDDIFRGLHRLYILKGGVGTGKSTFMRKIGLVYMDLGYNLEYYHCSLDNQAIDGLIIPDLKIGFVDGTYPHMIDPIYPGVVEKIIDLSQYQNDRFLLKHKEKIMAFTDEMKENLKSAHKIFKEAKEIHWKKEEIYLSVMDFNKANQVIEDLKNELFSVPFKKDEQQVFTKRFFGASTPKGAVNFIDNITEGLDKRYIIKGRPGSGKSTLMKKIAHYASECGLSIEYYPCALDPNSLDMIIIPKLSIAIIDGTAPHIVDPYRKNDQVIDMFALCMDKNVEIDRQVELTQLNTDYKLKMAHGINYLSEAKRLHDKLKEYSHEAMDFKAIDAKRNDIVAELLQSSN